MGKGRYEITPDRLTVDTIVAQLADPAMGAVVTFVGVVRCETGGREVLSLEYEAYPEMAEQVLEQIADEVRSRWPEIRDVAIVHRVGRLEIGDTAVVIALSAAHRAQLFDALHYTIDRVQVVAPSWKKEGWTDGEEWRSEQ